MENESGGHVPAPSFGLCMYFSRVWASREVGGAGGGDARDERHGDFE